MLARHDVIRAGYPATTLLPEDAVLLFIAAIVIFRAAKWLLCVPPDIGSYAYGTAGHDTRQALFTFFAEFLTKAEGNRASARWERENSRCLPLVCRRPLSNVSTLFWGATDDMFVKLILIKQTCSANGAEQHWFFPGWRRIVVIAAPTLRRLLYGILLHSLDSSRLASDMRK